MVMRHKMFVGMDLRRMWTVVEFAIHEVVLHYAPSKATIMPAICPFPTGVCDDPTSLVGHTFLLEIP